MNNPAEEFDAVCIRLDAGDQSAAAEVFERFSGRLIGLARSRLDRRLQGKVDPDDVMQSVFRSFFVRQRAGKFVLDGWHDLWSLLVTITVRKCSRQVARFKTNSRDVDRDVGQLPIRGFGEANETTALARDPTPLEAVTLAELVERLMTGLNEREQQMVTATLQGYSPHEISLQVDRTERTVQRVLARVRLRAESLRHSDQEDSGAGVVANNG